MFKLWLHCCLLLIASTCPPLRSRLAAAEAEAANVAEFGQLQLVPLDAKERPVRVNYLASGATNAVAITPDRPLEIEWNQPRDVRHVRLRFTSAPPDPATVTVQWWQRVWPDNGTGGWMRLDDPFNGSWKPVTAKAEARNRELAVEFLPLTTNEVAGIKQTGMSFRQTYKLRVIARAAVKLEQVIVQTDAVLRPARVRFEWDINTTVPGKWPPRFEAINGRVVKTTPAGRNTAVVEVSYADSTNRASADRGLITCRGGGLRGFSISVDEVLAAGGLLVRDVGVFVSDADKQLTHESWSKSTGATPPGRTIAEQVASLPEQSLAQANEAIPAKPPVHLWLGAPNLRQEFSLGPRGDVRLLADSLRSEGPDAERRPWAWSVLAFSFAGGETPSAEASEQPPVTRDLAEGWLPVVHHHWSAGGIDYTQTSFATTLTNDLATLSSTNGLEPLALLNRFELHNPSSEPRVAWLWTTLNQPQPLRLAIDGTLLLSRPSDGVPREGLLPVRGRFDTHGRGELDLAVMTQSAKPPRGAQEAVRYRIELAAGETHAVDFALPYVELLEPFELAALKALRFEEARAVVTNFWTHRVSRGMTYEVPEPVLNHFFKANLWHVLISTDIDPETGSHQHGAATHQYKNFLNETMMVARSLEMRGEHAAAGELIETFLRNQGVKGLPGNFRTKAGVLYAAHPHEPDPYTAQGYNMHHGWGLWGAAEHFLWTRDQTWLRGVADRLALAADWIVRERQATKYMLPDGARAPEYGLAPAGDLEDVEEYLYFYATDAYYHLGMKKAAAALAAIQHPLAARLASETAEFARDIQASVAESIATAPAVRLRGGAYVPYVPPRVHSPAHLQEGWIREGLYPALHLLDGEVFPPDHPYAAWMIDELEDNVFPSAESGYGIPGFATNFFSLGGFTLQPNLLDLAVTYLRRDQTPNFLRAFYNTLSASLYPDALCFAEWVPRLGQGGGPLYKTPDECKFIQWMRQMLILEQGDTLELGLGVPRAWMKDGQRVKLERAATFFGPLNLEIVSRAAQDKIEAKVSLQRTSAPKTVLLRARHPEGKLLKSARVNGAKARINAARQTIELPASENSWQVVAEF